MTRKQLAIIELVFGVIGFVMIAQSTSLLTAIGVFICLFANNAGHSRTITTKEQ